MVKLTPGTYNGSGYDCNVIVYNVTYRDPNKVYIKAKIALCHKETGLPLESPKNYKLDLKRIAHWKKISELIY